jgi:hypothetical protein
MQQAKVAAEQELRQLCQSLGLLYEPQDWGIINADERRLSEFIAYYEANPLSVTQRFELGELILASANERLLRNESLPEALLAFLARHRSELSTQLEYWRNLWDDQEFPVGNWLRSNFSEPRRE